MFYQIHCSKSTSAKSFEGLEIFVESFLIKKPSHLIVKFGNVFNIAVDVKGRLAFKNFDFTDLLSLECGRDHTLRAKYE